MGICPMYWGTGPDGSKWFASEMKAIVEDCDDVTTFPPVGYISSWFSLHAHSIQFARYF